MAVKVTTKVKYVSGMEYWAPRNMVDKLAVSKVGRDEVSLTFEEATQWIGSMSVPVSTALVLARALLIVAEGHADSIEVKLP